MGYTKDLTDKQWGIRKKSGGEADFAKDTSGI